MPTTDDNPEFDKFARGYEALIKPYLKIAGASREYFAEARVNWLSSLLREQGFSANRVMDFGCGTGMSLPLLQDTLRADEVIGIDPSKESLEVARELVGARPVRLGTADEIQPEQKVDLAFCNGVFHHIPLAERASAIDYIHRCLRPGGYFALWENNPWNPIQYLCMSFSEIDKNAIPIQPTEARRLVDTGNLRVMRTDYLFFFPGYFGWLRPVERRLIKLPVGAQYQVLSRKESV